MNRTLLLPRRAQRAAQNRASRLMQLIANFRRYLRLGYRPSIAWRLARSCK